LVVITDPDVAKVTVRNNRGFNQEGNVKKGRFELEVPVGTYDIQVTSPDHASWKKEAVRVASSTPTIEQAELRPLLGSIVVLPIEPDATIFLNGKKPDGLKTIKKDQIEIENLAEDVYTLRVEDPDYAPFEIKAEVQGGYRNYITYKPETSITKFIVRSEPGATIFIDGNMEGRVEPNGVLKVSTGYKPGEHTIKAELDKFEPSIVSGTYKAGEQPVEVRLTKFKSSPELGESFRDGTSFWDAPPQWRAVPGKLSVTGSGVGLVKGHFYDDFTMTFDVIFTNGKGAAWIIRARDKQNFYLFQITGQGAVGQKTFRSFIYKNGQPMPLSPAVAIVEDLNRPGDSFVIKVEVKGNSIKHFITVGSNPRADDPQPLGFITDNTFSHGAIGFTSKDGEEFIVQFINVKPQQQPAR
jgi:hypothetical protein